MVKIKRSHPRRGSAGALELYSSGFRSCLFHFNLSLPPLPKQVVSAIV